VGGVHRVKKGALNHIMPHTGACVPMALCHGETSFHIKKFLHVAEPQNFSIQDIEFRIVELKIQDIDLY
jgi:hypothetical protein